MSHLVLEPTSYLSKFLFVGLRIKARYLQLNLLLKPHFFNHIKCLLARCHLLQFSFQIANYIQFILTYYFRKK